MQYSIISLIFVSMKIHSHAIVHVYVNRSLLIFYLPMHIELSSYEKNKDKNLKYVCTQAKNYGNPPRIILHK